MRAAMTSARQRRDAVVRACMDLLVGVGLWPSFDYRPVRDYQSRTRRSTRRASSGPRTGFSRDSIGMKQPDPRIITYAHITPTLAEGIFVADTARVIGDVHIGEESSIWFGAVIRGDVHHIRIGRRVNLQDNTVIHVTSAQHPTLVADDVTVGHRVVLHGCAVGRGALVGMGAIVMDQAEIGEEAMVGAGALVTPGTVIPPRTLAVGTPARVKRALTADELDMLRASAAHYVRLASEYLNPVGSGLEGDKP